MHCITKVQNITHQFLNAVRNTSLRHDTSMLACMRCDIQSLSLRHNISMLRSLFYMTRHNILQCGILLSMHNTRKGQIGEPIATGIHLPLQHREITLYRRCVWERGSKPSAKLPQGWKPPHQAIPGVIEERLLNVRFELCLQLRLSRMRCK